LLRFQFMQNHGFISHKYQLPCIVDKICVKLIIYKCWSFNLFIAPGYDCWWKTLIGGIRCIIVYNMITFYGNLQQTRWTLAARQMFCLALKYITNPFLLPWTLRFFPIWHWKTPVFYADFVLRRRKCNPLQRIHIQSSIYFIDCFTRDISLIDFATQVKLLVFIKITCTLFNYTHSELYRIDMGILIGN
jgi:hypothetical protein